MNDVTVIGTVVRCDASESNHLELILGRYYAVSARTWKAPVIVGTFVRRNVHAIATVTE